MRVGWAAGALLVVLLAAPGALAHAVPAQSDPGPGERLDRAPAGVFVAFTEEIYQEGSWIQVWNSANERVDAGDLEISTGARPEMTLGLPPLPDGAYRIVWQTYSKTDGHTVGGSIGFAIGGFVPPDSELADDPGVQPLAGLSRAIAYSGYSAAFGAFAFLFFVGGGVLADHERRRIDLALVVGAAAATLGLAALILDTARQTGLGLGSYLASDGGEALLFRLLLAMGIAALTALWAWRGAIGLGRLRLLVVAWLALVWLGARVGHASVSGPWAVPVQTLHAVAISAWIGGLGMLILTLRDAERDVAWTRARRFGTLFMMSVGVLVATGLMLTVGILGIEALAFDQWAASAWGLFLIGKVVLAGGMVALAVVNRYVFLAEPAELGRIGERIRGRLWRLMGWKPLASGGRIVDLRRLVSVEASVGVVVLVLAGLLMATAAPQPGIETTDVFETGAQGDAFTLGIEMTPAPVAGEFHTLRMFLADADTQEPETNNTCGRDDCLLLRWWLEAEGADTAQSAAPQPEGDGWWRVDDLLLGSAGNTTFRLDVQTGNVFLDRIEWTVAVPEASG